MGAPEKKFFVRATMSSSQPGCHGWVCRVIGQYDTREEALAKVAEGMGKHWYREAYAWEDEPRQTHAADFERFHYNAIAYRTNKNYTGRCPKGMPKSVTLKEI